MVMIFASGRFTGLWRSSCSIAACWVKTSGPNEKASATARNDWLKRRSCIPLTSAMWSVVRKPSRSIPWPASPRRSRPPCANSSMACEVRRPRPALFKAAGTFPQGSATLDERSSVSAQRSARKDEPSANGYERSALVAEASAVKYERSAVFAERSANRYEASATRYERSAMIADRQGLICKQLIE